MTPISAAEVVATLASLPPGIVATDADGTLWTGDVADDWLAALEKDAAPLNAEHLRAVASRLGLPDDPRPGAFVQSARNAYDSGHLDEATFFSLVAITLGHIEETAARRAITNSLAAANLPARLIAETLSVLAGARAHGHRIVVVSASPKWVVEEALALARISVDRVIGLELTADQIHTRIPRSYGEGKRTLLRAYQGDAAAHLVHVALGDSGFDAPMLACAGVALAVRPKASLVLEAASFSALRLLTA